MPRSRGFTLVEMVVAAAIFSIGLLALTKSFHYITVAVQTQKARILANNLAQEKVEVLKNNSYYSLLVTTSVQSDSRFSPPLAYDADDGHYPPEEMTVSGIAFTRAVRVDFAEIDSDVISTMSATSADPGLKQISVYVVWRDRGEDKYLTLTNLHENPYVTPLTAEFNGIVYDAEGGFVQDAVVKALEHPSWKDRAAASGDYSFEVAAGSYTLHVSSYGYYDQISAALSVSKGGETTKDFTLQRIHTGSFTGSAWLNDHLVLSRVVGSSDSVDGVDQEWVEVFNPTTYTWTMTDVGLKYQRPADASRKTILVEYSSTTIAPGGFFVFANTVTLSAGGILTAADAVWDPSNSTSDFPYFATQRNVIATSDISSQGGGALELYVVSTGETLDIMGWDRNGGGQSAPFYETNGLDENVGLEANELYYRYSTASGYSSSLGPAYDSGDNEVDWERQKPITDGPRGTGSAALPVVAGVPADGAVVTATDGISRPVSAEASGSPPVATFTLPMVSTGTWSVYVSSGERTVELGTCTIPSDGASVGVPNASSDPAWTSAGYNSALLTTENDYGYVTGSVKTVGNVAIPGISVRVGIDDASTGSDGRYFVEVSTGYQTVRANPNNLDASYVEESAVVLVELGEVTNQDFILSSGGTLTGYVTTGSSPLPNITVVALQSGSELGSAVSDASGIFSIGNLPSGAYTVKPSLDPVSFSTPSSYSASLSAGSSVSVGTFTITSAFGTLSGSLTQSGSSLTTGALVVASSSAITYPLPTIDGSNSAAQQIYYMAASLSDGSYEILVRGSTTYTYNVSVFYPTLSGESVSVTTQSVTGVSVAPGATTTRDFAF